MLSMDKRIEVVGAAATPGSARAEMRAHRPRVVALSLEPPSIDAMAMLKHIMQWRPLPVIAVASSRRYDPALAAEALEAGAVDCFQMPADALARTFHDTVRELSQRVVQAAAGPAPTSREVGRNVASLIAIGASTGGTEAINTVLSALPPHMPPVVVTQHIPAYYSALFARRVDGNSPLCVQEAQDGQPIRPGHVYIAPGDRHLLIDRQGGGFVCRLQNGLPVNRHRPSVDVMFLSVARAFGNSAIGVLLTGMGRDGAQGLLELHRQGAFTMVQDESSSVVWGMPEEALKLGAADDVVPLECMAERLIFMARKGNVQRATESCP